MTCKYKKPIIAIGMTEYYYCIKYNKLVEIYKCKYCPYGKEKEK